MKLFLRRFLSIVLTIGVLVGGNILLIEIEDNYSPKLIKQAEKINWESMKVLSQFIPFVALSLLNVFLQVIIEFLVKFETWDYPEQEIKHLIWRNYSTKMVNFVILFAKQLD